MNPVAQIKEKIKEFTDIRGWDLSREDLSSLSARTLIRCWFDTETKWPPKEKLPQGFDPQDTLELGRNPGLGIRKLHSEGITGSGVHVAIIDQKISQPSHKELSFFSYKEVVNLNEEVSMHGPAVASILGGKTCGVAPDVSLHYFTMPAGVPDFALCTRFLQEIISYNEVKPYDKKIRVLSCSFGTIHYEQTQQLEEWNKPGLNKWLKEINIAKQSGIVFIDDSEDSDFNIMGGGSYGHKDDFESQNIWLKFSHPKHTPSPIELKKLIAQKIVVPTDYRTWASSWNSENQFFYGGLNGISWAIPYLAGVIALGLQINNKISREQVINVIKETVYINKEGLKILDPGSFVAVISNL